tara:strand:+ start:5434 stop:5823 length:390 start_codon:yes stop_codon:yes gene_type:complete
MPRARNQQYGMVKKQDEVVAATRDAEVPKPSAPPGSMPLQGRSKLPNQPVTTPPDPTMGMGKTEQLQQRQKALRMLFYMEPLADRPGASREMQNTVRKLKRFVGNLDELVNEHDPRLLVRNPEFLAEEL